MKNKNIEEIEETLQNKELSKYHIGEQLYTAQLLFDDTSQFNEWIINLKYKEDNWESTVTFLSKIREMIAYYLQQQQIMNEKKIFKNGEIQVTEQQINDFLEKQDLTNTRLGILTDIESEIIFIGHLLTNPESIQEYVSNIDHNFFNVGQVQNIYNIIKVSEGDNLCESLIERGQTATDLKCILKITENKKDDINEIFLRLSKYEVLRKYSMSTDQEDVLQLLFEIPTYGKFEKFSITDLESYLDGILHYSDDKENKGYIFSSNYKQTPPTTVLNDYCVDFLNPNNEKLTNGVDSPFPFINSCLFGLRPSEFMGIGMLSNAGKTRFIANLFTYLVFVQNKNVLAILNETTKEDITMCIITTIINNPKIQNLHGFNTSLKEEEIRKCIYSSTSEEQISKIVNWVKQQVDSKLHIQTINDYTDLTLKNIIVQNHFKYDIDYVFYDTLKVSHESTNTTDDLKKTATMLSELAKQYRIFIACTFQLTDDTLKSKPRQISRLNIASSKQIYHVFDSVLLFKEISKEDYNCYNYIKDNENTPIHLDTSKRYYLCNIDKNRNGEKPQLIFEVNLDYNTWIELGKLDNSFC